MDKLHKDKREYDIYEIRSIQNLYQIRKFDN